MKKNLEQAFIIKVGDALYTPTGSYSTTNKGEFIITTVEKIIEENGIVVIIDSDGDTLKPEWLGVSFFLSEDDMKWWCEKMEEKFVEWQRRHMK